jgi:hypothetical protein
MIHLVLAVIKVIFQDRELALVIKKTIQLLEKSIKILNRTQLYLSSLDNNHLVQARILLRVLLKKVGKRLQK